MTTATTRPPAPTETPAPAPAPTPTARPPTPAPADPDDARPDAGIANQFPVQVKLRLPNAVIAAGPDACIALCVDLTLANHDFPGRIELNPKGELELTMPPYYPADAQEGETYAALHYWNLVNGRPGYLTLSSAAYILPNGAVRYPDAAWTAAGNVPPGAHIPGQPRPYCPDFVVEIRSPSQFRPSDLAELGAKMTEYMDNGAQLGWLIDPLERTVRIYRAGVSEPELLRNPETLDGEDVLPGFAFPVRQLIFDLA